MTATTSVTFRVDAGREIGLGHLRRCVTLATYLRDAGCSVRLVTREPLGPELRAFAGTHPIHCVGWDSDSGGNEEVRDADATLSAMVEAPAEISWVVVDSYRLAHRWEKRVRDAGHRVMAIDDLRHRMHHADLLVSDSEAPFEPKLNERGNDSRALVGRRYALVDPECAYFEAPDPRRKGPRRLMVSYGATDGTGETMKAVAAIGSLRNDSPTRSLIGDVDVVVGPFNPMAGRLVEAAKGLKGIVVHLAPASLVPLLRSADLFLTAGGNSLVEALAMRKPCLVTVTADNQDLMVRQLAAEGIVRPLGTSDEVAATHVAHAITGLLADFESFAAQVASRPVFDHLGARRIAAAMLERPAALGGRGYCASGTER